MNKHKTIVGMIWLLFLWVMMGCVEKFEAGVGDIPSEGLVVEGDIISDSVVVFQLSKTMPLGIPMENEVLLDEYLNVDAQIKVKGNDGTFWSGEYEGKGRYRVDIGTLHPDMEYHLEIEYEGDIYRSEPQKPLKTSGIEKLSFKQPDLEGPVFIMLDTPENKNGEKKYYLWYFEEDWEVRAEVPSKFLYDPILDKVVTYTYPPVAQGWCHYSTDQIILGSNESYVENRVVGKIIQSISNTDHRLSVLYSIRIQQRDLSRKEYEYYQERTKQNNEMGGLFTPQPSELPTNISCSDPTRKVIGYVGCNMGIAQKQLYISGDEVCYLGKTDCKLGEEPKGSNSEKYWAGFQIANIQETGMGLIVEWASKECVDVRSLEADIKGRPSWWPNDYLYDQE